MSAYQATISSDSATMSSSYKFQGWLAFEIGSADGKMKWQGCEPKKWDETDVDIKVTHCGICGSDLHTLRSGWGATLSLPMLRRIGGRSGE